MSSNTRQTKHKYLCLHFCSLIVSAAVIASNLPTVNSEEATSTESTISTTPSTTVASTTTENETTPETTTLQNNDTQVTTTPSIDSTTQSTTVTDVNTTTASVSITTQSPDTTADMSSENTITTVTTSSSATTSIDTATSPSTTTTTTSASETTSTEAQNNATEPTNGNTDNTTTTEAPVTTTTQGSNDTTGPVSDNTSTSTTTSPSDETTEAPSVNTTTTIQTTTQGSNETTSEAPNTTISTTSSETTEAPSTDTTEPPSDNTTTVTDQSTTSVSVDNTTTSQPQTTTKQTTTTAAPTTTTTQSYQFAPIYPDTENAVVEFTYELKFTDCSYNKSTIENKLSLVSSSVIGCNYIRVKSIKSCTTGRRKRRATSEVSVETVFGIDAQTGTTSGSNVSSDLYVALSAVENIDVAYLNETRDNFTGALTSKQICDSDICTSALVGRPGFVCVDETNENNTQRCAIIYFCDHQPINCGEHGHCYVETEIQSSDWVSYTSKCRCTDEQYFRYEGAHCAERVMTWELAVIICVSASGALILLLLFIIIVLCCRNASNSADVSFEDSELMFNNSGITSTNGRNGRHSSKGVENQGYMEVRDSPGSWKPEASANTYAHIESKLREHNYDMQIKRPVLRKSDEITEF